MNRILLVVTGLGILAATATAGPNGYRCQPGTAKKGVGCTCPAGYAGGFDADYIAICVRRAQPQAQPPPPPPVEPTLPPEPPPPVRQPHASTIKVNVSLDRFRPPTAAPLATRPALEAEAALSIEGLAGTIRSEQEQILIQLIDHTADSEVDEKSDYLFRLAELYTKQTRFYRLKASDPAAAHKSKDYLLKSVQTYKKLTNNDAFRNYPKMDTALFYYGYTLQLGKYMKEARAVHDRLLKEHPNSKFVPEAHLVFADYHFDQNQLADAEARYKMVLKFPKSPVYYYAMYRMGWIHLGLQRYQEALETFFQVAQATKNDSKQAAVNREARRDFVRAYAEIGKPDKAYAAFQRVDARASLDMLGVLADIYQANAQRAKALVVYQAALASAPSDANACAWQLAHARVALGLAGENRETQKTVEVCAADLGELRTWATSHGASAP